MTTYDFIMIIHVLACVILFIDLVYVSMQKPSPMQSHIILLLVAMILIYIGYYIELKAPNVETAMIGTVVSYLGKPFIGFYCLMIICNFYDIPVKRYVYVLTYFLAGLIFFSVFTTSSSHLYYSDWSFDVSDKLAPLKLVQGPLYPVYLISTIIFFILCVTFTIMSYRRNRSRENRVYATYFILTPIFAIIGYAIYLSGLSADYDTSVMGLFCSSICLSVLFFKYRIFDMLTLAKDEALDKSPTGLIIVDKSYGISYANNLGNALLQNHISLSELRKIEKHHSQITLGGRVYSVTRRTKDVAGKTVNISYEFSDITDSFNYQNRLEAEVEERTYKIENIQRKVISAFASVVEARSLETGEHIVRTAEYVSILAHALKEKGLYTEELSDRKIQLMIDVAPLHDIGKIAVPDGILLKPGRLTDEEYEVMKVHSEEGARIIESTLRGVEDDEYVDTAIEMCRYHHERFDGKGYPDHLVGNDIPLSAKIMAIADTYDALISVRCYKEAYTKAKAIEIMKEESNTHFDPILVDIFLSAIGK